MLIILFLKLMTENEMISVEKANQLIEQNTMAGSVMERDLGKSLGYVLADTVYAPVSLPPFNQSAMDGYAIGAYDIDSLNTSFKLVGEVKAGDLQTVPLKSGETVRIFTGAPVPDQTVSVIMQEMVTVKKDTITIHEKIKPGSHIRNKGEQIEKGNVALEKGVQLTAAGIGFLSSMGMTKVQVYAKPKIGLIVTGSELIQPGGILQAGQIYESNSATLVAAARSTGFEIKVVEIIRDDLKATINGIEKMAEQMDVVILSGGISVGDYDFVEKALRSLRVERIFYKINQKPGKPIFFGKTSKCLFFALPGNPAASLLCYYLYVFPAIRKMSHELPYSLSKKKLPIKNEYIKKGSRAHFLKAKIEDNQVEVLSGQSSAMLHTFGLANALIYVPAEKKEIQSGELVDVYLLP